MQLLEREAALRDLDGLLDEAAGGRGRAVLVRGEAGIGKTSLVRAFVEARSEDVHVLWGGCDDLLTARPLGPIWDMAFDEPGLADALRSDDRYEAFGVLYEMLSRSLRPTVLVIDDLHWADDSTLDLVKFLGRRIDRTHGLLVMTYRDGEISGDHPLRVALGDLPPGHVERIGLEPLSPEAVSVLAGRAGSEDLWQISEGNPFFVTELIASGGVAVPGSIRDAVRARLLRLDESSRGLVELASVNPGRTEIRLLKQIVADPEETIRQAEEAGILEVRGDAVTFRHELARRAIEGDLPEIRRRSLNLSVLEACEALGEDLSRCAHHAREAGDADSIVRLLPDAARRAADLESHREAVQHLRALEPYLDRFAPEELADHYELWAWEEHLEANFGSELVNRAVLLRRELGDPRGLGRALLLASRIAWIDSRRSVAVEHANEAASVLESVGGEDLAQAYSTISQLAMLANDEERAMWFGEKALAVAGEGPSRARAHALNNIGSVKSMGRYPEGVEELEESMRMSAELGLSHDELRAAINLAWTALFWRDLESAEKWIELGTGFAAQREMPSFESYVLAEAAILAEMRGDWASAEAKAREIVERVGELETSRAAAWMVLGRIQVRRGEPDAKTSVLEAWDRARRAGEIQREGPAGSVVAEYAWLGGMVDSGLLADVRSVMEEGFRLGAAWHAGEIAQWLFLLGEMDRVPAGSPEPYRMLAGGDWKGAADFWLQRGIPYDAAVALSRGSDDARLEALSILDGLGAVSLAARIRSELQSAGVQGIPRGPSRATRDSPLGLTPRQSEVLGLLGEGLSNAEIADRLFVSTRTVDHHVSAILGKLGAAGRFEAVEKARQAGFIA